MMIFNITSVELFILFSLFLEYFQKLSSQVKIIFPGFFTELMKLPLTFYLLICIFYKYNLFIVMFFFKQI